MDMNSSSPPLAPK